MPISSVEDPAVSGSDQPGQAHDVILQLLNRQVGDTYFSADAFDNAEAWNGIPIVYASEHPDLKAFETDPDAELERIRKKTGRRADIVGHISGARIETAGHPKLRGYLNDITDPEVNQLIEAGTISPSTGFWGDVDQNSLKGSVKPNHLLIFEEDLVNQPRDRGAMILNKETGMKAFTSAGAVMSAANKSKFQKILDAMRSLLEEMGGGGDVSPPDEKKPVTNAISVSADTSIEQAMREVQGAFREARKSVTTNGEIRMYPWVKMTFPDCVIWSNDDDGKMYKTPYMFSDGKYTFGTDVPVIETYTEQQITNMTETELASKDAEIASLKEMLQKEQTEKQELATKMEQINQAAKDAAWTALKNKLPPGMVHKPEDEAATRELFEKDPISFTNKLLDAKKEQPKGAEGQPFVNKDEANDPVAIGRELRRSTGRIR